MNYSNNKGYLDFILSVVLIITLSPIFVIIILILAIQNKGCIFYTQKRIGLNDKLFKVIKFKTMNDAKDSFGHLLSDKDRITKFGRILRNFSLDELPQILNVLIGNMSFIGPRPLLPKYLPLYNDRQRKRHNVKPGITGWAQVNGRNQISWKQKFEYDIYYVENISVKLDLKIFFLTIKKILIKEGINANTTDTMEAFNGKN